MSIFNGQRLSKEVFQIDVGRMRKGWYTDAYFRNIVRMLEVLDKEGYTFQGRSDIKDIDTASVETGNIVVEIQFFTRRKPFSLVAGVDEALAILQECTGYFDDNDVFINTYNQLEIEAVEDGTIVTYGDDPQQVQPVLKVRGRYQDFGILETPILGVLSEATQVATNVYNVLAAAKGKDILFFPARFAHYKMQPFHGYAYSLAVQAFNRYEGKQSRVLVSTDGQAEWWGGVGGGTVAHASIACFLGDTSETMLQFSRVMPAEIPRIALVDFHNDCVGDTLKVMRSMFKRYWELWQAGKYEEAQKYKLFGVRPDTSGNMRDVSVPPLGEMKLDCGVNPRLVWALRESINVAYKAWEVPIEAVKIARQWCEEVKIVVTGGFDVERINKFEALGVPADIYGVGSSLLANCHECDGNNDYTADIVRVKIGDSWYPMAKVGRSPGKNPNLKIIKKGRNDVSYDNHSI